MSTTNFFRRYCFLMTACLLLSMHYYLWGVVALDIRTCLSFCYTLLLICHCWISSEYIFKINKKQIIIAIVALITILFGQNAAYRVVWIMLFLFCVFHTDYLSFLKALCIAGLIVTIIFIVSLLSGVIGYNTIIVGDRIRYTVGSANANGISLFVFAILSPFLLKYNTLICKIACTVVMFCVYIFTDSRAVILAYCLYLIFYIMLNLTTNKLSVKCYIALISLLFLCPWYIQTAFVRYPFLDVLLSRRLYLFSEYISDQQTINYIIGGSYPSNGMAIDNSYILVLFSSGIIVYAIWYLLLVSSSV